MGPTIGPGTHQSEVFFQVDILAAIVMAKDLAKMLPDVGPTSGPIPDEALVPRFYHDHAMPECDSGCCSNM
jgi:hypothetical protein